MWLERCLRHWHDEDIVSWYIIHHLDKLQYCKSLVIYNVTMRAFVNLGIGR